MDDKAHEGIGYMKEKKAMVIQFDNQGAISLKKNPTQHVWTKHIYVQHQFVQERAENDKVTFKYCSTDDMVVDVLTKELPKERHNKLIIVFGLETS